MTAAISEASMCLSLACWRIMSSWRRGSVSSWITSPNLPNRPSAKPTATPATTAAPPASRRRRLALRFIANVPAPRSWTQLLDKSGQLPLEVLDTAVILDQVVGAGGLFPLGELACLPLVDQRMAARLGPPAPNPIGGDYGNRRVERLLHARLKQERHLDHSDPGLLG